MNHPTQQIKKWPSIFGRRPVDFSHGLLDSAQDHRRIALKDTPPVTLRVLKERFQRCGEVLSDS